MAQTVQPTEQDTCRIPYRDLVGEKFHYLEVVSFSHFAKSGHTMWLCKCKCGNTKVVEQFNLTSGRTKSCGCLKRQIGKTIREKKLVIYDGVSLNHAASKSTQRNNTSGFRGVSWVGKINKWRVSITIKGIRHYLGSYSNFDDAVQARLSGEKILDDFIETCVSDVSAPIDQEKLNRLKMEIHQQVHAKERVNTEFKRFVCKQEGCAEVPLDMSIAGGIQTQGHLLVSGTVQGDITSGKAVMINGRVEGNVQAQDVYIPHGKILGNVVASRIFCSNLREQIQGFVTGQVIPFTRLDEYTT